MLAGALCLPALVPRRSGGGFSPADLSLDGWWDASQSYTGTPPSVTALPDLTGNGHDLTYESSGGACVLGTLNGKATAGLHAASAAGVNTSRFTCDTIAPLVGSGNNVPWTFGAVVLCSDISVSRTLFSMASGSISESYYYNQQNGGSGRFDMRAEDDLSNLVPVVTGHTTVANTPFSIVFRKTGATYSMWINGLPADVELAWDTGTMVAMTQFTIGCLRRSTSLSGGWPGQLGPSCFKAAAMSDTECAALSGYFDRWLTS